MNHFSDITITIDDALLEQSVLEQWEAGGTALEVAEQIAAAARELAPVGETGEYQAGIIVQEFKGGARVLATDFKSAWMEFGVPAHGIPGQFILRNAAASLGLKFRKSRG